MNFTTSLIQVDLTIPCDEMTLGLQKIIQNHLEKKYQNKAFETYGVIRKINKINKLIYHHISNIEGNLFMVYEIEVEHYIPQIYDTITLPIKKKLSCGLFLEEEHFKILVSQVDSDYQENKLIPVTLTDIRFEKDAFHCLAKIANQD